MSKSTREEARQMMMLGQKPIGGTRCLCHQKPPRPMTVKERHKWVQKEIAQRMSGLTVG